MAEVAHIRCYGCQVPLKNSPWPYCQTCNLALGYRAMPILLGMLLLNHNHPARVRPYKPPLFRLTGRQPYPHSRYILD